MKKTLILIALVLSISVTFAQEKELKKEGWTKKGNVSVLFNQSTFSNWLAGGENNIAGNLGLNYDFNYAKGDINWDNKIIASYGISKIKGAKTQKTDDRLELNSLFGKKAKGYWYYSAFANFKTQMDTGFDAKTRKKNSHFFSPAFLQFGPGMLWKKSDNLKVNFAPLTSKFIFVHDEFTNPTDPRNMLVDNAYFGVKANKTSRYELGAAVNAYYKANVMQNVAVENILNLYTNYLEDPQNLDIDYTMNVVMTINKYLSANFSFQAIYDDNAYKGFQVREVFGVGVNYGF